MLKAHPESKLHAWKNSLVGQLLIRFWICHIIFFSLIGSIQYNALKNTLYLNVEQNLKEDFHSIRNSMINWLLSNEFPPGRLADLSPGNFVAFYTNDYDFKSIIYSYGRNNNEMPFFLRNALEFDLYEKAILDIPFVLKDSRNEKYMLMVKPVLAAQVYHVRIPLEDRHPINSPSRAEQMNLQLPILGYAVIGEPLTQIDLLLERNLQGYIFNALFILLFSTLLTAMVLQKPLEPLLIISSTARKIAGGQYDLRLPYMRTTSEIEQLRETLNHMLGQMEQALNTERTARDRMSRFMADASHELRTPLTSIRGFLEILQRNRNTDQETLDYAHKTMLIETERLIRLTEGLLTLNRISQNDPELARVSETSLIAVFRELVPLISPLLEKRTLWINGHIFYESTPFSAFSEELPGIPVKSDELKQILYNLINNAIQHTDSNGVIEITVRKDTTTYNLTIKDNGKGIPTEDIPYIFERFFRGDRSRSRKKGQGAGLGLAIVSEIVIIRGGKITVASQSGAGTAFTIIFPVQKPDEVS